MENQNKNRPASSKQLGYIRRLKIARGESPATIQRNMTSWEASQLIKKMLEQDAKAQANSNPGATVDHREGINEARLGMAMKECFRFWTSKGTDIWKDKRESFIRAVIATHQLFEDIGRRAEVEHQPDLARK